MSYKLTVAPRVLRDLDGIVTYIGEDLHAPDAANNLLRRLLKAMERLKEFPFEGEKVRWTYMPDTNIRRVVVENYLLFYRADDEGTVTVLRILYGGTDYINYLKFE